MTASRCDKPQPPRQSRAPPSQPGKTTETGWPYRMPGILSRALRSKKQDMRPRKVRGPPLFQYTLGPKMAVPTRTIVAPWFTAMR